jgi:HD-GYP domain-containing protein (c-di-GMP phosphodiesterase class II)
MHEAYPLRASAEVLPAGEVDHHKSGMAASAAGRDHAAVLPALTRERRRLEGGVGTRELCSHLCEALADDLHASDCLVSQVDAERGVLVDLAGFTRTPQRLLAPATELPIGRDPTSRAVLEEGRRYTTWVDEPGAGLVMRLDGPGGPYLVEVWSEIRTEAYGRAEIRRSLRLVSQAAALLDDAARCDHDERLRFQHAAAEAREIGAADLELPAVAEAIGERLLLDQDELREVRLVALVHEAGRSHIPGALHDKVEPLTPVEWAVVQRHTLIGQRMLSRMPHLRPAVAGVGAIREHWDGGGYPHGFAGEEIPLSARIVAVCAAYRAIRRGRPGRPPLDHGDTIAELQHAAGIQFDPRVVDAAVAAIAPAGAKPTVRLRVAAI